MIERQFSDTGVYAKYAVRLAFVDSPIAGGNPSDPKIVEGWIRTRMGIDDIEELRRVVIRNLQDIGQEVDPEATYEEIVKAAEAHGANRQTNVFKRDSLGLYVEARQIKAMLKEAINIAFPGVRGGPTAKGYRSLLAERVFPVEPVVHLRRVSDGTVVKPEDPEVELQLFVGHVTGPQGPRSTLTHYQVARDVEVRFTLLAADDYLQPSQWERIWLVAERNGLGALRSQGFGQFVVPRGGFQRIDETRSSFKWQDREPKARKGAEAAG